MSSSDHQQQQQHILTRYNFPDFKNNKLNTGLFDLNEDLSSTFEAFCCPTSLAFRLEFALNLDRKVQYFAKKRLKEIKKENPQEYHRQLDHYARHVYSRLEQSTENNDLFNGCCHILASGMTLPFALCVTGVFVEKEYFHFEEHYDDEETGVNTFKTKTPQQERDDDSEKGLIACFCSPCQMARMYREVILRGMPMPSLKLEPMEMRTLSGGEKKGRRIMKMISSEEEERERESRDEELEQRNCAVEPFAGVTSTSAIEPVDENGNEKENEKNEVDTNMAPSAEHQHEQQQEEEEDEDKDEKLPSEKQKEEQDEKNDNDLPEQENNDEDENVVTQDDDIFENPENDEKDEFEDDYVAGDTRDNTDDHDHDEAPGNNGEKNTKYHQSAQMM